MPKQVPFTTLASPFAVWSLNAAAKNLHNPNLDESDRNRSPTAIETKHGTFIHVVREKAFRTRDSACSRVEYDKELAKQIEGNMVHHERRRGRSPAPRVLAISMRPLMRHTSTTFLWPEQRLAHLSAKNSHPSELGAYQYPAMRSPSPSTHPSSPSPERNETENCPSNAHFFNTSFRGFKSEIGCSDHLVKNTSFEYKDSDIACAIHSEPRDPIDYHTTEPLINETTKTHYRTVQLRNQQYHRGRSELSSSEEPNMSSEEYKEVRERRTQEALNRKAVLPMQEKQHLNEIVERRGRRDWLREQSYLAREKEVQFEVDVDIDAGYAEQNRGTYAHSIGHSVLDRTSGRRVINRICLHSHLATGLKPSHLHSAEHSTYSSIHVDDNSGVEPKPGFDPPGASRLLEDPLGVFPHYDARWNRLSARPTKFPLNFANVPWPMLVTPRSQADITADAVAEFIFHPARICAAPQARKLALENELKRWHPDHIERIILVAIRAPSERRRIKDAAELIYEAMADLV